MVIGSKATEPASTVVSDAQRGRSLGVLHVTPPNFETRGLKICSAGAANADAPPHARTAYVTVAEYNKKFQQVRLYGKSTEVDTSADIHFT